MAELLRIERLCAGYGDAVVLPDLSLSIGEGEVVALLGRNGMGKTTLLNSIIGATRQFGGVITFAGQDITGWKSNHRAKAGIGWVPQERNIFRSLTVEENMSVVARPGPWSVARIYKLFPRLEERRANLGSQLSGGEQQMLAIGRALALNPRLLLLDEPLEGLAPIIVEELLAVLRKIVNEEGVAALLVEQGARKILSLADRAAIIVRGRIVHASDSDTLRADPSILQEFLGVGGSNTNRIDQVPRLRPS